MFVYNINCIFNVFFYFQVSNSIVYPFQSALRVSRLPRSVFDESKSFVCKYLSHQFKSLSMHCGWANTSKSHVCSPTYANPWPKSKVAWVQARATARCELKLSRGKQTYTQVSRSWLKLRHCNWLCKFGVSYVIIINEK